MWAHIWVRKPRTDTVGPPNSDLIKVQITGFLFRDILVTKVTTGLPVFDTYHGNTWENTVKDYELDHNKSRCYYQRYFMVIMNYKINV